MKTISSHDLPQNWDQSAYERRVIACLEACNGISTSALKGGVVSDMLEALEYLYTNAALTHGDKIVAREAIAKAKGGAA